MDETPEERIREAEKTLELLRRVHPANAPTLEDVAELHELHAEHERRHGRLDRAEQAAERAKRLRRKAERP